MSPYGGGLQRRIGAAVRLVRRRALLTFTLTGLLAVVVVLLGAWLVGAGWGRPTPLPLVLDLILLAGLLAAVRSWRAVASGLLGRGAVAAAAERRLGLDAGSLRGVLELGDKVPVGTSAALARRAERMLDLETSGHSSLELAGELGERWLRWLRVSVGTVGVALLALTALAFRAPDRTSAGWQPLLHPVRQLTRAPLPALVVAPGAAQVARGQPLRVRIDAPGREVVFLRWRLQGDVVHERVLPVLADTAAGVTGPVVAPGSYWVAAPDGEESAHYELEPIDALLLGGLVVDVSYPRYLQQPAEHYEGDVPPLEIPAGTTLRVRALANRPLAGAALVGGGQQVELGVAGRALSGSWRPVATGSYAWLLRDSAGAAPASPPPPLEISIVPDLAPTVELTFPGRDTVFPADLRQPLTLVAADDHSVVDAAVVSWRAGAEERPDRATLALGDAGEQIELSTVLDASNRALAPGDTLKYYVEVRDASPGGQRGVSATYALRVPGGAELRARAKADARAVVARAEALAERTTELQRDTRNADRTAEAANARRAASARGSGGNGGSQSGELRYEETEEARRLLTEQSQALHEMEELQRSLAGMRQSMATAGLRDEELQRQMEEVEQLLDRLATPELRQELAALQQALEQLDPAALQQALDRLAQQQQQSKQQLDRALALLREAAREQELVALAQQARELATQQRALADAHEQAEPDSTDPPPLRQQQAGHDSTDRAALQQQLAERGDSLLQQLRQLGDKQQTPAGAGAAAVDSARAQVAAARDSMSRAASSAAARRAERAAQQGRAAAAQLEQAAAGLDRARAESAQERQQESAESLQQATRDALALAQQQQVLQQQMEQGRQGQPQGQDEAQGQEGSERKPGRQQGQQQGPQQGGQKPDQGGGRQAGNERGSGAGGQRAGGEAGQPGGNELSQLREQQQAVQQGLQQLGRNLADEGQQTGSVSREASAALNRANTSMQQTVQGLEQAQRPEELPAEAAGQTVDALNRLALALLENAQRMESNSSAGLAQARQELADAAQQQSSINGQGNSLLSLNLSAGAQSDQVRRLGREQQQLADRLTGLNDMLGGREDATGQVDLLAREASAVAAELSGGRIDPGVIARQQRLFHRLLDAGRSLEQEETSTERTAERPGPIPPGSPPAVAAELLRAGPRFRPPTTAELSFLPPAYRRLVLDYFERLNHAPPVARDGGK